MKSTTNDSFRNITEMLSPDEFEAIKNFILAKGDRKTYRNFDNNNPHYRFGKYDAFLGAETGQRNINNDPKLSDFNELTIADWEGTVRYYKILIARPGKTGIAFNIRDGMKEGNVYLVKDSSLDAMVANLPAILEVIKTILQQ